MGFFQHLITLFKKKKVYVIIGPTASGKSSYGIKLAQNVGGEIISCDSRQIYSGLEIFSGATVGDEQQKIPHHLVSIIDPPSPLTAQGFVDEALENISEILSRGKTPVVVGGTAYWAQALMYSSNFPTVETNDVLRETLHGETTEVLFERVKRLDPTRAATMDPKNRKRLVRALEIIDELGHVPQQKKSLRVGYDFRLIYISPSNKDLKVKIQKNISKRIEQGLFDEARAMRRKITDEEAVEIGLGYKHIFDFLDSTISQKEFEELMLREEYHYAKRQKTFCNKLFKSFSGTKEMI